MSNGSEAGNSRHAGKEGQLVMLVPRGDEAGMGPVQQDRCKEGSSAQCSDGKTLLPLGQ